MTMKNTKKCSTATPGCESSITKTPPLATRLQPVLVLAIFLGIAAMMGLGCNANFKNPFAKKAATSDQPRFHVDTRGKDLADFQGHFLAVKIDGAQAQALKIVNNQQLWSVGDCSPAPALMFEVDQEKLAPIKNATISINPLVGGRADLQDIWLYTGQGEILPGKEIQLNSFDHIVDGKITTGLSELPAGKYRLSLQVNGYDTWDRQLIHIEVK